MENVQRQSILDMARGAIKERTEKRTLSLTVEFIPDSDRVQIGVRVVAKSKLEPTNPVTTSLYIAGDGNGEITALEMVPQVPGQMDMNGGEQEEPHILRLVKQA